MEFKLSVVDVTNQMPNVITLKGDADVTLELPLEKLGIKLEKNTPIRLVLTKEKDENYRKYKVYMWGLVYHVDEDVTRISIGGLQLDIKRKLPLKVGDKVYIGLL